MRAMWSGAVSFGLVSVPVKAYAATTNHDIRFHQVHAADGGRITYKRTCSLDGAEVVWQSMPMHERYEVSPAALEDYVTAYAGGRFGTSAYGAGAHGPRPVDKGPHRAAGWRQRRFRGGAPCHLSCAWASPASGSPVPS